MTITDRDTLEVSDWQSWLDQAWFANREHDQARPTALLIAGPTASGKSALALKIADITGGEIINADSMQVYADLRILSARPTEEEEQQVRHHLYGFVPAVQEFSVGAYLRAFEPVLADLVQREKPAIVVGGTGLCFKTLTLGLTQTPPVPKEIKAEVAAIEDLHAALSACDPAMAARLNPADRPRLERALEVFETTGRSLLDWWREGEKHALLKPGQWQGLRLDPPRDWLMARINQRFEAMIAAGALDEVRCIMDMALPRNRGIMKAHGMPHLIEHLRGLIDLETAITRAQLDTRRYAKRQGTFGRHQLTQFTRMSHQV